ncbi:ATP-binding SpoIIE family protein phosphatase, partial [Couchioplanes caeruleus]
PAAAADRLGFDETRTTEVAIVVSEVGSNLYKHGDRGRIVIRCLRSGSRAAVELVAIDAGPGMADLVLSRRDGHSTVGTLGIGMGAIARLSSQYDAYSGLGRGTVLTVRLWSHKSDSTEPTVGGLCRPTAGEQVCGDRFVSRMHVDGPLMMVVDGLGHGPLAAAAAAAAVDAFQTTDADEPAAIVEHVHRSIRQTRGAAVGAAKLDPTHRTVRFAGVGNIAGFVAAGADRCAMASVPGIAGYHARSIRAFSYRLEPDAIVVMHSDGVTDRWSLSAYPGLVKHSALIIAATLLRDAGTRHDDACVLVAKAA